MTRTYEITACNCTVWSSLKNVGLVCPECKARIERITVAPLTPEPSQVEQLRAALGLARSIINSGEQPSQKAAQQIDDALSNTRPPAIDAWKGRAPEPGEEKTMTEPRPEKWNESCPDRLVDAADKLAEAVTTSDPDPFLVRQALREYRYQRGWITDPGRAPEPGERER
jgi:hypothetical protein